MTNFKLDPESPWSFLRGLQPVSLCDWPGGISSVFFFGGCNLRCPTCHNAQIAWRPEELPPVAKEKVFSFLQARLDWLDGIVLTGGEPSQVPKIHLLLSELKSIGLPLKLDTNGLEPELIQSLIRAELIDMIAVDIKGPWSKYPALTGQKCSEEMARNCLSFLLELAQNFPGHFYFRCTWVPELTQADIEETRSYLPPGLRLHLQDYFPPPRVASAKTTDEANEPDTETNMGTTSHFTLEEPI